MNYLKMGHRLEAVTGVIKSNQTNQKMMEQLRYVTPILQKQVNYDNIKDVMKDMSQFQDVMDEITKQGKMVDGTLTSGLGDVNTEANVDMMLMQMKNELAVEYTGALNMTDTNFVSPQTNQTMGLEQNKAVAKQ